jgi:hypothetical protein
MLRRFNYNVVIHHDRIFMLWHVVVVNQLFLHVTVAYFFLLRVVFCFDVFSSVCWCRVVCVSPLFLLIVNIIGNFADFAPPLTSEWGTLLWYITLFSVHCYCASQKIIMSPIRCVWSNLYWYTSRVTIYIVVCHCMAHHTFLCALLLPVTEILLWVRYIVYIQIYIEKRHG